MRMKFTFKSLLLAAGLLAGSTNAWAETGDEKTIADIDCTGEIVENVLTGKVNSMTIGTGGAETTIVDNSYMRLGDHENVVSISENDRPGTRDIVEVSFDMAWGDKEGMGSGIALQDNEGEVVVYFNMARWDSKTPTSGNNMGIDDFSSLLGAKGSGSVDKEAVWNNKTHFEINIDYATKKIKTKATLGSTIKEYEAAITNSNSIAKFIVRGYGAGTNPNRASLFGNLIIKTIEGDYTVQSAKYTVKWMADSEVIKEEERYADVNSEISLLPADLESFFVEDAKYMVLGNDADGKTVDADGNTVVTISVRKAEKWAYTVSSFSGDVTLDWGTSGEVWEDEPNVTITYPRYQYVGTSLVEKQPNGYNFTQAITVTKNNDEIPFEYSETDKANVVYYSEAEDIEGSKEYTTGTWGPRSSNGKTAVLSSVTLVTLDAGVYKIASRVVGKINSSLLLYKSSVSEDNLLLTCTTDNTHNTSGTEYVSEAFILSESTAIIANGGYYTTSDNGYGFDYIYIQKVRDLKTEELTSTSTLQGYKTYYDAETSYKVDENTTVYSTAYNEASNTVTLTSLDTKVIPAGTPVIVKTSSSDYTITLTETATSSADAIDGNELKAADAEGVLANAYILARTNEKELAFYQYEGSLEVGDVYLPIANSQGIKSIAIVVDGTATSIETVEVETEADGTLYNVAGQQVSSDYKGIVIKNGKKYLNK